MKVGTEMSLTSEQFAALEEEIKGWKPDFVIAKLRERIEVQDREIAALKAHIEEIRAVVGIGDD